jgi:hypothetical protein
LNRSLRRKPINVTPNSRATETASVLGAETAHTTGTPAITAFWRISKLVRPLTTRMQVDKGSRPPAKAQPTSLSTAL